MILFFLKTTKLDQHFKFIKKNERGKMARDNWDKQNGKVKNAKKLDYLLQSKHTKKRSV